MIKNMQDKEKLILHLNKKGFGRGGKKYLDKELQIKIPKIFSISENPKATITFLRQLYKVLMTKHIETICFDYSKCEYLGFSASVIMDVIILAVNDYRRKRKIECNYVGNIPLERRSRGILLASGLPYHLQAESELKANEKNIECFELVSGCHSEKDEEKVGGTVATNLTLYFERCLATQKLFLKNSGKSFMSTMLGEVLDNCEIHGGENATWYTQGHYQIYEDKQIGEMQLIFLSFGDTIYEGLKQEASDETRQRLKYMMQKHQELLTDNWNEETIYTVLALQAGISRLRDKDIEGYEYRGSGTVSMIEQFYNIGKTNNTEEPSMVIVSGHTIIKFDDKYKMKTEAFVNDKVFGNTKSQIIAFNNENDIYKPADSNNVRYMKEYFPGTVISLKFYIDRKYIQSKKKEKV